MRYLKAVVIRPPWQPVEVPLPLSVQSVTCCSEKERSVPLAIWKRPSKAPTAENAQHEPQPPWSFTGVTAPFERQSMASLLPLVSSSISSHASRRSEGGMEKRRDGTRWRHSSYVRSENLFTPIDLQHTRCSRHSEKSAQMQWRVRALCEPRPLTTSDPSWHCARR